MHKFRTKGSMLKKRQ